MKQRIKNYLLEQGISNICVDDILPKAQMLSIVFHQADINKVLLQKNFINQTVIKSKNNEDTQILARLYALCDTVFSTINNRFLSLFSMKNEKITLLLQCGLTSQFTEMAITEETAKQHLAARAALSAWLQCVDSSSDWVKSQELLSDFYPHNVQVFAIPICSETGAVLGVLYGENNIDQPMDNEQFSWYIALTITLMESMQNIQAA